MSGFGTKKYLGIDISDYTVEIVEIEKKGKQEKITKKIREHLPEGVVKRGYIQEEIKLRSFLSKLFKQHKLIFDDVHVTFGLPESQVYTFVVHLEARSKKELDEKIKNISFETVPLENVNIIFDHQVVSQDKNNYEVLIVAASRKLLQSWLKLFQKLNAGIDTFDSEILAVGRSLFKSEELKKPVMVVDIGAVITNFAIFDKEGVRYTHSINESGNAITHAISQGLNISYLEAEQKKKEIGLDKDTKQVLLPILEHIVVAIQNGIEFYEEKSKRTIGKILVVGGTSNLIGLLDYIAEKTAKKVEQGNLELPGDSEDDKEVMILEAYGLARKGFSSSEEPVLTITLAANTARRSNAVGSTLISDIGNTPTNNKRGKKEIILLIILVLMGVAAIFYAKDFQEKQREKRILQQQENRQQL